MTDCEVVFDGASKPVSSMIVQVGLDNCTNFGLGEAVRD